LICCIFAQHSMSSAKEREILERQRQLAAQLQQRNNINHNISIGSKNQKAALAAKNPPPPPLKAPNLHPSTTKPVISNRNNNTETGVAPFKLTKKVVSGSAPLSNDTAKKDAPKPPPPPQDAAAATTKRPSKKTTHAQKAFIAAARAKLVAKDLPQDQVDESKSLDKPSAVAPNTASMKQSIARKSETDTSFALLTTASLVKLAQSTTAMGDDVDASSGTPALQPDDFWKHIREWDFVSQYAQTLKQQASNANTATAIATDDNTINFTKPLPNVFVNARHYMAAWAPLCLAECRAQLLQEALTSSNVPTTLAVKVETNNRVPHSRGRARRFDDPSSLWHDDVETGMYVQLSSRDHGGSSSGLSFMTHDLVLLLKPQYRDVLKQLQQGIAVPPPNKDPDDPHAYASVGLIGHCEATYKEINGMVLKVSKRQWAQSGEPNMFMLKIGSNVTALREFTALCRMESIPMQKYLLATHLEKAENRRKLSRNQTPEQLLQAMGGTQALGRGFLEYTRAKFNTSQLAAIAASALEYGDGGFTLIKGPPGTGSKLFVYCSTHGM
jgi:hypothetical protein